MNLEKEVYAYSCAKVTVQFIVALHNGIDIEENLIDAN